MFITSEVRPKKLGKIQLSQSDNLIVKYSRKEQGFVDVETKSQGLFDLRGISGGGVWLIRAETAESGIHRLLLAGLVIEADINRSIIVATRMHWLKLLIQTFNTTL